MLTLFGYKRARSEERKPPSLKRKDKAESTSSRAGAEGGLSDEGTYHYRVTSPYYDVFAKYRDITRFEVSGYK